MKLDNVFYGFTKDGERKLLSRKMKTAFTDLGDVARTVYYDLEKKEYIESYNIDEKELIPITYFIEAKKRMSRKKIIEVYLADCDMSYNIRTIFYGNIINRQTINDKMVLKIRENVLLATVDEDRQIVSEVKTGYLYPSSYSVSHGAAIEEVKEINKDNIQSPVITKKKLLELDYKKEL